MIAYKYRGGPRCFTRDLASITQDYFWAASLSTLNDPLEAKYDSSPLADVLNLVDTINQDNTLSDNFQEMADNLRRIGIFSLAAKYDDHKLWAHYAGSHTGFCVGYDVTLLKPLNNIKHNIVPISYAIHPASLTLEDMLSNLDSFLQKTVGVKHIEWEHEQESRIVTDVYGKMEHDFRAIKSIHFGIKMPEKRIKQVMKAMRGRGITYYQMQTGTFNLEAMPLPDAYPTASPYLYSIAPVTHYALATDPGDEERMALLPYLLKAVEIQRREPYCSEVDYAGASTDNAKAGQIWVNYRYKSNYYNRHFTKRQIRELHSQIIDL